MAVEKLVKRVSQVAKSFKLYPSVMGFSGIYVCGIFFIKFPTMQYRNDFNVFIKNLLIKEYPFQDFCQPLPIASDYSD